jgi:hypothetical protein
VSLDEALDGIGKQLLFFVQLEVHRVLSPARTGTALTEPASSWR